MARNPAPFKLERFFAKYEFNAKYLLCCSDCEPLTVQELLDIADPDSLDRWTNLRLAYTESQGLPALRAAIASLYDKLQPDQLVVCVPEEGIYLTMRALLQSGDKVVCTYPGYQSLYELANATGCSLSFWEPEAAATGRLTFDINKAKALITPDTKLVVVNFPHNPTGATLSAADYTSLIDHCRSVGAWLFSDEMYRFTELPPLAPLPSAVDCYDKTITLCGLSKSWGLPGLRVGWIASQAQQVLQQVLALKDYTTICSSAPSEILALAAVRATAQLTQRSKDIISSNLTAANEFFSRWSQVFEWQPPEAGPIAFPRLITGEDITDWCSQLVMDQGVLLLPADVYDHEASTKGGHFRISLGRKDMPECLQQLDIWLSRRYQQQ